MEENRKVDACINFPCKNENKFLIQTCSQPKMSSTKLPEVHRVRKELNPNLRPEKQHAMPKKGMTEKPRIGQGRAGLRREHVPDHIDQPFDVTRRIPERSKMATGITNNPQHTSAMHDRGINNDKSFSPDVLLHLLHRSLPRQQNVEKVIPNNKITIVVIITLILKKILHFKRVSYLRQYRDWTKHSFKNQRALMIL